MMNKRKEKRRSSKRKDNNKLVLSVVFFCYLKTQVSLAIDSITANQSLSSDQTIVYVGGIFPYPGIELQHQELNDSQVARLALESLETDVKRANKLVDKYKNRACFYLLVKCRHIVKEVQDVTRDIRRSLATLSIANTDVLLGISNQVNKLQNEMQKLEIEASQSQLQVFDKLKQGLDDQTLDQGFANDMLAEITMAIRVPLTGVNGWLTSFAGSTKMTRYLIGD
ncbi:hypothetical protein EV2_008008 [Malus domestica]|uniref:Uncharacterized protein n=1 Tax=Malus domestica TaxID=3750 RepID=A0A498IIQ7_MALDO|nr:hypothetical protein DVH24_003734 [Malus domestica]